jgi:4'-phosphopantetheinyl transferase
MITMDAPTIRPSAPGAVTPRATEGSVHVWRADLEAIEDDLEDLLCAEELARAARIVHPRHRVLWTRSRGVLRALLGRYLDRDPLDLRFVLGPHGKPALSPEGPTRPEATGDLRFNLSHSGGLALVAVTAGRAVGIDVEVAARRRVDELAVAARVLGDEQARRLADLNSRARARAFLRAWVAHEAVVKCLGLGLGLATPLEGSPPADLWTAAVDVGPRAAAAVAVEGGPCELRFRDWPT